MPLSNDTRSDVMDVGRTVSTTVVVAWTVVVAALTIGLLAGPLPWPYWFGALVGGVGVMMGADLYVQYCDIELERAVVEDRGSDS